MYSVKIYSYLCPAAHWYVIPLERWNSSHDNFYSSIKRQPRFGMLFVCLFVCLFGCEFVCYLLEETCGWKIRKCVRVCACFWVSVYVWKLNEFAARLPFFSLEVYQYGQRTHSFPLTSPIRYFDQFIMTEWMSKLELNKSHWNCCLHWNHVLTATWWCRQPQDICDTHAHIAYNFRRLC